MADVRTATCSRAIPFQRMNNADQSSKSPPVIEFREVGYRLANQSLLQDISFSAFAGETLVLLGRSGAGKTTALKLINRLLTPVYGEVRVNGRSTTSWDPILLRRSIGWVIQESGLFPHYSVESNIAVVPKLEQWPRERVNARISELMQLVGLDSNLRTRYPHQLSGGQRQRVGVARALAADPGILLMDEPFGALDPITRAELQKEFLNLQRRLGKTVVIVTHDLREAMLLGTRIALFDTGKLVGVFACHDFANCQDERVREYVAPFREALPI